MITGFFNNVLARIASVPQYLIFFVSSSCWTRCSHCWYNESWKKQNITSTELQFEEIEEIVKSIPRFHFLSLTGGEAFMRDDIVEITRLFSSKVNRYQIPTSGFDTTTIVSKTRKILELNYGIPFRVDVSLDGTEQSHDRIRNRAGCFSAAIQTIKELNLIKDYCPFFDVGVISTISHDNEHEIEALSKIIENIHPDGEWMINIVRGAPRDPSASTVDYVAYQRAHYLIEERIKNHRYVGHAGHRFAAWLSAKNAVRRKFIYRILKGQERSGFCAAGSLGGVIYNDGSVYPCEMTSRSFGNIRDYNYDLGDLWQGRKADACRNLLCSDKCLCTQECFHSINVTINPRFWPSILAERVRLALNASEKGHLC